jgi:hypothetical protein
MFGKKHRISDQGDSRLEDGILYTKPLKQKIKNLLLDLFLSLFSLLF